VAASYRGVLFDLFGTLIAFDATRLPELRVGGQPVRTTVAGLGDLLATWVPGTTPEAFLHALLTVSDEMARTRAYDHIELPSRERFRRALERVGCDEAGLAEAAVHLSRAHMELIAAATVLPPAHGALLAALRPRYRLGLVSNFDDTGTAYDILWRHGIASYLDTVVVSESVGLRKPHPALVRVGLAGLAVESGEVLFVGDTFGEDVRAAQAAGVDAVWIDARGEGPPPAAAAPRYVVRTLPEIAAILDVP
jgi:5'-nucleotidase